MDFYISKFSCWSPNLQSYSDWSTWSHSKMLLPPTAGKPVCEFIPAGLRRRCSAVIRGAMCVAAACLEKNENRKLPLVFASRHGESDTTNKLLLELYNKEEPSPNSFTMSVHNTCCGVFTIQESSNLPCISVCSRDNLFAAALYEVSSLLSEHKKVLVVIADTPVPGVFNKYFDQNDPHYAIAMVLERENGIKLSYKISTSLPVANPEVSDVENLIKWLFSNDLILENPGYTLERQLGLESIYYNPMN